MASAWTITADVPTQIKHGGAYISGRSITYTTSSGTTGVIDVTMDVYKNPLRVKELINERVAEHDAIGGLRSEGA